MTKLGEEEKVSEEDEEEEKHSDNDYDDDLDEDESEDRDSHMKHAIEESKGPSSDEAKQLD